MVYLNHVPINQPPVVVLVLWARVMLKTPKNKARGV